MLTAANVLQSDEYKKAAMDIAKVGRFLAQQQWSPATSSNYSARLNADLYALTRSGIDKYEINPEDVIVVGRDGRAVAPANAKPSAETLIHCKLYESSKVGAVLHTHSVYGTRLSMKFAREEKLVLGGYELLKGLEGTHTHDMQEIVPILPNTQDMVEMCQWLKPYMNNPAAPLHGFLIAGHGLYTWGENMAQARRHVETYEFLFQALAMELIGV